jgi:hypothetical protein
VHARTSWTQRSAPATEKHTRSQSIGTTRTTRTQ